MILYTIYPTEVIFNTPEQRQIITLQVGSRALEVEVLPQGKGRVVRLLSTDPADYLQPCWQPGTIIPLAYQS